MALRSCRNWGPVFKDFPIYFAENTRVEAYFIAPYLEPFGVEGKVSPFWKLDIQDYNIYQTRKNLRLFHPLSLVLE